MAVRFRRIEDRKQSVVQLRRQREDRRERRRLLPKIVIGLVVLAVAGGVYLLVRPPRVVAPFAVEVDRVRVQSPVSGTVTWQIGPEARSVAAGQSIARVRPSAESAGSPPARRLDLRLRLSGAAGELQAAREHLHDTRARLAAREEDLKSELARARQRLAEAKAELQDHENELSAREREFGSLRRLHRLSAATAAELSGARRAAEQAEAEVRKAHAALPGHGGLVEAAEAKLEALSARGEETLAAAKRRVDAARSAHRQVQNALKAAQASDPVEGAAFVVTAPSDARVLRLEAAEKGQVRRSEVIATLYRPETKIARAYAPARLRDRLGIGRPVRLYLPGREEPVRGSVARVEPDVVRLPARVRDSTSSDADLRVTVEIATDVSALAELPVGAVGKAVIEKD